MCICSRLLSTSSFYYFFRRLVPSHLLAPSTASIGLLLIFLYAKLACCAGVQYRRRHQNTHIGLDVTRTRVSRRMTCTSKCEIRLMLRSPLKPRGANTARNLHRARSMACNPLYKVLVPHSLRVANAPSWASPDKTAQLTEGRP